MLRSSSFRAAVGGFVATALFNASVTPHVYANLPTGAHVVHGNVAITQAGGAMAIQQASRNAIVNWQSFNIGVGNSVRIEQSGAAAAMLARVTGGDPSQLLGSLKADGKLFLINPRGIVVGKGAVIDTAGFLGSTLDVSDAAFLAGSAMTFQGESAAGIVNLGKIVAREGNVMLLAHTVKNAGEINAAKGKAALGAGTEVYVVPETGSFAIKLNLAQSAAASGVENTGTIAAAQAELNAAGGSIYELAVNQSGVVRATGAEKKNGRVILTAAGGTIGVSGEVSARNADGSGGEILVGGDFQGKAASVANAARTVVTATAKLDASAATSTAAAGRVIVWADDATRFLGTIDARGQGGGFAEVSGKRWLDFNPSAPVTLGKNGTLLLDPDALIVTNAADSGTSTSDANPFVFGAADEPAMLNVATLQNQLALTNVTLDTSTSGGDVRFEAAVVWSTDNTLRVQAGGSIFINADITGGANSTLALYPGRTSLSDISGELGGEDLNPAAELALGATVTVGTLVYGANGASNVADQTVESPARTGGADFQGNLNVGTLEVDLSGGSAGVFTNGTDNAIGTFRTSGTGNLRTSHVADHHDGLEVQIVSTSSAPWLAFETPGTLRLLAGSSLNYENEGDIILASTGGAFVNEAGTSPFGTNVRFLIYSSSPGATTKGGLVGADVFNHAYDFNDDFSGDRVSRFLFTADSALPTLVYTANSFTRSYGAVNPTFTYTIAGWEDGVTNDVTGAPTLSSVATQSSGVGGYAIRIAQGTLTSSNYDFSFVPGTLTIERAPLTITANNKSRRIGLENPSFDASFSGFVLNETQSVLDGTLAFATPATGASAAGEYAITPSGLTSANYQITFVPGTLTLTETAALLISADNATRTYGAANPTFTASFSGFVGGENESIVTGLQFSTEATQASGIGGYAITPFGATAPGYDISYEAGVLTIERAPLTISIPNQSRVYGDANNLFANFNGLVNGETSSVVSGLSLTTDATLTSPTGNYAISGSGATAANYSITYVPGMLAVTPARLTVTIADATRRYGDADPVFNYNVSGLRNGDSAADSVHVTTPASLASADAGIGDYGIIAFSTSLSSNYTAATVPGTLTITPRPLTIAANNTTRIYGDANPTFTATLTGLASFDSPEMFGNLGLTTQATPSSGVGSWGITFPTVANPNYAITSQFGTLTITPAPLTTLPLIELARLYGRADPALALPEVGGLKLADTVESLGLRFELPAPRTSVGTHVYRLTTNNPNYTLTDATGVFRIDPAPLVVAVAPAARFYGDPNPSSYEITANGLAFDEVAAEVVGIFNPTDGFTPIGIYAVEPRLLSTNYVIESFTGGAFQINPRPLIFTAADRTRVYGDANPFFFGSISGFVNGDSEETVVSNHGFTTTADERSRVGTYAIRPSAQVAANYMPVFQDGTLTVTPAEATVVIGDTRRLYGQVNPIFTVAETRGLRNDDDVPSLALSLSAEAGIDANVGTYAINGVSRTPNYTVTFVPGTLTIDRAPAFVAGVDASRPFGEVLASPLSVAFTGFLPADEVRARSNWQEEAFTDQTTLAPGAHGVGLREAEPAIGASLAKNYDITVTPATVHVTPRPLVIRPPDLTTTLSSSFANPFALPSPEPVSGAPAFTVIGRVNLEGKVTGTFAILPEIVPGLGVSRAELDRYFAFDLRPGTLTLSVPQDVVDLNQQLDPSRFTDLNNGPINTHVTLTPGSTITVEKNDQLTIAAPRDVALHTEPLTRTEFANFFSSFDSEMGEVKASLTGSYTSFLAGAGKKGTSYEGMSAEGRALLAGWMEGTVTTESLRAGIAEGDAAATEAFGFIMPTMIERTRDKDVASMTPLDRDILGRLADLTEKRRADTVRIAQQKYEKMLADQAKRAETATAATVLFFGPGDFENIVDRATEEAMAAYIGGALAGASVAALTPILFITSVSNAIFPHAAAGGAAGGGPVVVAALAVALAVRSVQIDESIKNEEAYHALMASYKLGQDITSIADLKSSAMDNDIKLSTLMLATELINPGR